MYEQLLHPGVVCGVEQAPGRREGVRDMAGGGRLNSLIKSISPAITEALHEVQ